MRAAESINETGQNIERAVEGVSPLLACR
jgi:hypothetical protein